MYEMDECLRLLFAVAEGGGVWKERVSSSTRAGLRVIIDAEASWRGRGPASSITAIERRKTCRRVSCS